MKKLAKKKLSKEDPSSKKNLQQAYFQPSAQFSNSQNKSSNLASSLQMLVSTSQTQRFKLDFLVSSYEQLIYMFKEQKKQFFELMKTQFQRHHFYYSQIVKLVKKAEQRTKKMLKQKLEDFSNIFQLKISFLQIKLKAVRKILFQNNDQDSFFTCKKNKIKNPHNKKGTEIGKASSYEEGLDFDQELKEIYNQRNFTIGLNFIENEDIQSSLQNIKFDLIKDWQPNESSSVSFSSFSNPQQSLETFQYNTEENRTYDRPNPDQLLSKVIEQNLQIEKSSNKIQFFSNQTNTSAKLKPLNQQSISEFNL